MWETIAAIAMLLCCGLVAAVCVALEDRDHYRDMWRTATAALDAKDEQIAELTAPQPSEPKAALSLGKRTWEWH